MPEIDNDLSKFSNWVDDKAIVRGNYPGERGIISKILYNPEDDVWYYAHHMNVWFEKFGIIFRNKIPEEDHGSRGTSVPLAQVREASNEMKNAYIVIYYKPDDIFYGCNAKTWNRYTTTYDTVFMKKTQDNIPQSCIPLRLLENMRGFKNRNG